MRYLDSRVFWLIILFLFNDLQPLGLQVHLTEELTSLVIQLKYKMYKIQTFFNITLFFPSKEFPGLICSKVFAKEMCTCNLFSDAECVEIWLFLRKTRQCSNPCFCLRSILVENLRLCFCMAKATYQYELFSKWSTQVLKYLWKVDHTFVRK